MRYGLLLLPNAFLLVALLRMTFVGMATQRTSMFFFLCIWLLYSFVALFLGQIWPIGTHAYNVRFFWLSLPAWLCASPALWIASRRLTSGRAATVLCVFAMAVAASRFAMLNASMSSTAKLLSINCFAAVVAGSIFALASLAAEGADRTLWCCTGIFFLIYGFGYLAIGMAQPGQWAMHVFILAGAAAWWALFYFIGPRPEHLFTLEKLGIIWSVAKAFGFVIPIPLRRSSR